LLLGSIYRHARESPGRRAVIADGRPVDYRSFALSLEGVRALLAGTLPSIGGVAIIAVQNMLSQWILNLALRSLGITTVVARDEEMVARFEPLSEAVLLCMSSRDPAIEPIRRRWPELRIVEVPQAAVAAHIPAEVPEAIEEGRFGDFVEFTSGSTGEYKLLRRSGAAIAELCDRTAVEFRIDGSTLFHLHSVSAWTGVGSKCPLVCWALGAACVFDQRADWVDHLFDHPINRFFITPDMMHLLGSERVAPSVQSELQIYCGGGFLGAPLALRVKRKLGCRIFFNYAGTEFGVRLQNEIQSEEDTIWLRRLGPADLDIVDDDGRVLGDDAEGVIRVRQHACDARTYSDPPGERDLLFTTSDLAVRRADGRIRILGRAEDVLIIGGHKRAVAPIEERARSMLGVDSLCLFSRQTDEGEDYLLVAIEGDLAIDESRIVELRHDLGRYFYRIELRKLPEFPRQPSGLRKIDRREILRLATTPA
jgi:acyl-coenzyme A synthetase/AMP-(fatty) acid ligase